MREASWASSIFWMYTVLVDESKFGMDGHVLLQQLRGTGIQSRPLWQPIHRSLAHKNSVKYQVERADKIQAEGLSLPCSVGLAFADQQSVIEKLARFLRED